jgi:hypothetical protein
MKKKTGKFSAYATCAAVAVIIIFMAAAPSLAQEANFTDNSTTSETALNNTPAESNDTVTDTPDLPPAEDETTENITITELPEEETTEEETVITPLTDFRLSNVTPEKTKPGDVILNIIVTNTGTTTLNNLIPLIVARGFSSYDVVPIQALNAGETGTAFVSGNFAQEGEILLTVKINDKIFHDKVTVEEPKQATSAKAQKAQEAAKAQALKTLSAELEELSKKYDSLNEDISAKKDRYDTSEVSLTDLKKYIASARSTLVAGEAEKTNISIILAEREYEDQLELLEAAPKKPFVSKIKDNAILISAIAGAIITIITLLEILKKKKEGLYQRIKEIKVSKDTRVVVEKKKKSGRKKKKGKETKDDPAEKKEDDEDNNGADEIASAAAEALESEEKESRKQDEEEK